MKRVKRGTDEEERGENKEGKIRSRGRMMKGNKVEGKKRDNNRRKGRWKEDTRKGNADKLRVGDN